MTEILEITLDARNLTHDSIRAAFQIPDTCGRNLDALHDCLTERGAPTHVTILHWEDAEGCARRILAVLSDAAEENPRLCLRREG